MIVNGTALANKVLQAVRTKARALLRPPHLTIFTTSPRFETKKYLELKKRKANEAGILVNVIEFNEGVSTEDVTRSIERVTHETDAIVVQLPLPDTIDREAVIAAISPGVDADALNPRTRVVHSPVVRACAYVLSAYDIAVSGMRAVVVGRGRLVGEPVAAWLLREGADLHVLDEHSADFDAEIAKAELIVSGAGVPKLIAPEMISDGTVILDCGTSVDNGKIRGDADPACAEKARLFTPVPGGIGPLTVAMLLQNVVELGRK